MLKSDKVSYSVTSRLPRWQPTIPLLLAAGIVLGTAQTQAQDPVQDPAVQEHTGGNTVALPVKIYFNGMCPEKVSDEDLEVYKANKRQIVWTAYDLAEPDEQVDVAFSIFFDPFKNSELESGKNKPYNQVTSPKLGDIDAIPLATYKYTVVGKGCEGPAYDPRILVK
jgi:hypothetical protein